MSAEKYYSTDLSISIVELKADSAEQAEAIMQEFIDRIAPIMADQIRRDEVDWTIEENVLNEEQGVWEVK